MRRLEADFDKTFAALEAGLQVQHVAEFELKLCCPDEPARSILDDPARVGYDQFPVRNGGGIIGVLERQSCPAAGSHALAEAPVSSVMRPLDSSMLAAESQPVGDLLETLGPNRFRLVVKGGDIEGIVTPSDFLKLPVRLYAFMLITHLEMVMAAIRARFRGRPNDDWLECLGEERRKRVTGKVEEHRRKRLDPDPIEFTDFCDKRDILRRFHPEGGRFKRDLKEIEKLRNAIAHARNYLHEQDDLDDFLKRVRLTRSYIRYVRGRLPHHLAPAEP